MHTELTEELERGREAAAALVRHMNHMGSARCELPVQNVNEENDRLEHWKVTVELLSVEPEITELEG